MIDVSKSLRNFKGYQKNTYYTAEELQKGEIGGITETDSKTSGQEDGQYSTINKKSGKAESWGGKELGHTVDSIPGARINKR